MHKLQIQNSPYSKLPGTSSLEKEEEEVLGLMFVSEKIKNLRLKL
jgi:hypothetical protein